MLQIHLFRILSHSTAARTLEFLGPLRLRGGSTGQQRAACFPTPRSPNVTFELGPSGSIYTAETGKATNHGVYFGVPNVIPFRSSPLSQPTGSLKHCKGL